MHFVPCRFYTTTLDILIRPLTYFAVHEYLMAYLVEIITICIIAVSDMLSRAVSIIKVRSRGIFIIIINLVTYNFRRLLKTRSSRHVEPLPAIPDLPRLEA